MFKYKQKLDLLNLDFSMIYNRNIWQFLCLFYFSFITGNHITPEKPLELRIRTCTHKLEPLEIDGMMVCYKLRRYLNFFFSFLPSPIKFCISIATNKRASNLISQRTTLMQSTVFFTLHEIGSSNRCHMEFMVFF